MKMKLVIVFSLLIVVLCSCRNDMNGLSGSIIMSHNLDIYSADVDDGMTRISLPEKQLSIIVKGTFNDLTGMVPLNYSDLITMKERMVPYWHKLDGTFAIHNQHGIEGTNSEPMRREIKE